MTVQQLVAYLKYRAAQNNQVTSQGTAGESSGGGGNSLLSSIAKPVIKKGIEYGWQEYGQPLWNQYVNPTSTGGGAAAEGAAPVASEGAAPVAAEGVGGTAAMHGAGEGIGTMTASSWAAVAAPLIMAYLQYQKGSGVNEPVVRRAETRGMGKMIEDRLAGKESDPSLTYSQYGIRPKKLSEYLDPAREEAYRETGQALTPGMETIDPRGYQLSELYDEMHNRGSGHYQPGGTGNSGFSDQDIDAMFSDKDALARGMGLSRLPSWEGRRYDDSYEQGFDPLIAKNKAADESFNALDEPSRRQLEEQATTIGQNSSWSDRTTAQELWRRQKEKEELEKLLGYKLGGTNYGTF